MRKHFDTDGNEISGESVGKVVQELALGGQFDETSVTLMVYSKQLDRHEVSRLLDVQPTKAWNAGERHLVGTGRTGRTRIVDWGQWMLQIDYNQSPVDRKIQELLNRCTDRLENWHALNHKYDVWLTIGGHMANWNRELDLAPEILRLLTDRGLRLKIDVYWYGDFDDEAKDT